MLFYKFSDRHLSRNIEKKLVESDVCTFLPSNHDITNHWRRGEILKEPRCIFHTLYSTSTSHPQAPNRYNEIYYPETHLPQTQQVHQESKDLNNRIKDIFSSEKAELPFLKPHEEKAWIAFVQKDPETYVTEMVTFFKDKLHRLAQVDYQSTFEHLLFNRKGFEVLRYLFSNHKDSLQQNTISLLFDFIHKSSRTLLKRGPKVQTGSAFLLHIGFKLLQVAKSHGWPDAVGEEKRLLKQWERLFMKGKENPILGVALCEAVLAVLSSMEFNADLQTNPQYLDLLVKTVLVGCIPPAKLPISKYDPLLLQYGFLSFKELLNKSNDTKALLRLAAEAIFGSDEASTCEWNPRTNQLQFKSLLIDLESRIIEGHDVFNLQPIPRAIQLSLDYIKIFGERRFFVTVNKQDSTDIYNFTMKGTRYQIRYNPDNGSQKILKNINGLFCSYQKLSSALPQISRTHAIAKTHLFWRNGQTIYGENSHTGKIDMVAGEEGFHSIIEEKLSTDVLGIFDSMQEISQLFNRIETSDNTVVWKSTQDSEGISRIQLLRLGLEFATSDGQLMCSNFPGFRVAQNQSCAFLRNSSHALVLENKKGQKKVILLTAPVYSKKYNPYQSEVIDRKDNQILSAFNRRYVVFDLKDSETYPVLSLSPGNMLPLAIHSYKTV